MFAPPSLPPPPPPACHRRLHHPRRRFPRIPPPARRRPWLPPTAAVTASLNQAAFHINALSLVPSPAAAAALHCPVSREYVADVLERGFRLSLAGNRLFFADAPLLLWIFGPVLLCLCSVALVPIQARNRHGTRRGRRRRRSAVPYSSLVPRRGRSTTSGTLSMPRATPLASSTTTASPSKELGSHDLLA
uniref:Uncharacterized protein n=1 Tax=Arundo donax TaxID=35708 RepID=A0A0A9DDH2_ARUDO